MRFTTIVLLVWFLVALAAGRIGLAVVLGVVLLLKRLFTEMAKGPSGGPWQTPKDWP